MNVRLYLRYDGTAYHGWQIQNMNGKESDLKTIQGTLASALRALYGDFTGKIEGQEAVEPIGVSRTDAGVHADMYCASFHTDNESIPAERICYALKQFLPSDICVYRSEKAPDDFHARFDVVSKTYKYLFYTGEFSVPALENRAWHVSIKNGTALDLDAMKLAAKGLLGTHQFDAFCAAGGSAKTTERTLFDIRVEKVNAPFLMPDGSDLYALYVEGDGFLYNMVRIIAGTIVYAGQGKIHPADIPEIIASKNRKKAGITAPAQGLYLNKVKY
jgi:tRNA pseudouridine38-40 synthase